jgi:7-cyano-7-deazaguanine synthase in queuosine biosynthesis
MLKVVMFSGGFDSTALLFKCVNETGYDLHVHHIRLINRERREKAEDKAVKKLIEEARKIRPFVFSSNTYECPDSCGIGYTGVDLIKVGFVAGDIINMIVTAIKMNTQEPQNIEALVGTNMTEVKDPDAFKSDIRYLGSQHAFRSHFLNYPDQPSPQFVLPFLNRTREDIIQYIPRRLLKYTISCRRPVEVGNEFVPCGLCFACRNRLHEDLL